MGRGRDREVDPEVQVLLLADLNKKSQSPSEKKRRGHKKRRNRSRSRSASSGLEETVRRVMREDLQSVLSPLLDQLNQISNSQASSPFSQAVDAPSKQVAKELQDIKKA